jgi:hypothetical protein
MNRTGFAKFEARYKPDKEFMELFVRMCEDIGFQGFRPQHLGNIINGEIEGYKTKTFE